MLNAKKIVAYLLPLTIGIGCNTSAEDPVVIDNAVAAEMGGETEGNEAPNFGDPELEEADLDAEMTPVDDRTDAARPDLANARHVRIALAWGYLRPHPEARDNWIDWSGTIKVENAGVRVLRTLAFEDRDHIVFPRPDIHTINFVSHTAPHADGLLLDVILAPGLNPTMAPVTLTFRSGPITKTITLGPGNPLHEIVRVDNAGHVFAYHILVPDRDGCSQGTMAGRWKSLGDRNGRVLGVFKGRFVSSDGSVRGKLRGVYGVRANGKHVFFGKVISRTGEFQGLLVGRWGDGQFAGLVIGRGRIVEGAVRGHYFEGPRDGHGGFVGRWAEKCGEDSRENSRLPSDETEETVGR